MSDPTPTSANPSVEQQPTTTTTGAAGDNNNNSNDNSGGSSSSSSSAQQPGADPEVKKEDLDASIDQELSAGSSAQQQQQHDPDAMNLDGANDSDAAASGREGGLPASLESRIPTKKDASLREFLGKMDDYAPIIPDAVTNYYLTLAGLPPPPQTPPHLARLLALATQKFIADIAADAYQYSRIRSSNTTSNNPMGGLGGAAGFGLPGVPGATGATAGAAGGKEGGGQGKGLNLGVQRPGYGGGGQGGSQGRTVLTMEDLGMAVGEYGVNVKRGEFYR